MENEVRVFAKQATNPTQFFLEYPHEGRKAYSAEIIQSYLNVVQCLETGEVMQDHYVVSTSCCVINREAYMCGTIKK